MLALAFGFLGAVTALGIFCGGVFFGTWLYGKPEAVPRRRRRRKVRPTYRSLYEDGKDAHGFYILRSQEPESYTDGDVEPDTEQDTEPGTERGMEQNAVRDTEPDTIQNAEPDAAPGTESDREQRRLREEQAAFRTLQNYSAETAYGLGGDFH